MAKTYSLSDLVAQDASQAQGNVSQQQQAVQAPEDQSGLKTLFKKVGADIMNSVNPMRLTMSHQERLEDNPLKWSNLTANERRAAINLAPILLGGGAGSIISKIGTNGLLKAIASTIGYGAEGAAIGGGTQIAGNIATGEDTFKGAGEASMIGAATNTLFGAAGGVVPKISPEAKKLRDAGVVPTVGQAVSDNSFAGAAIKKIEELLGSRPLIGSAIENARDRARSEARNVMLERGNPSPEIPLTGDVQERLAMSKSRTNAIREPLGNSLVIPTSHPSYEAWESKTLSSIDSLPPSERDKALDYFAWRLEAAKTKTQDGREVITGKDFKALQSDLGSYGRSKSGVQNVSSGDASLQRKTGEAFKEAKRGMYNVMGDIDPAVREAYLKIDPIYSDYKVLSGAAERAAGSVNEAGAFTPKQVITEMRVQDKLAQNPKPGSLQDFVQDANTVLTDRMANSRSADRFLSDKLVDVGLLGGAGYGAMSTGFAPQAAGIAGLALIGSTRPGQNLMLHGIDAANAAGPTIRKLMTGYISNNNPFGLSMDREFSILGER